MSEPTENKDHAAVGNEFLTANGLAEKWEVVVASNTELQLDIDQPTWQPTGLQQAALLLLAERCGEEKGNTLPLRLYQSKGGNTHVVISLPHPLPVQERVAWQAILGSDAKREALCLLDLARGHENCVLLYMRKDRDSA